MRKSISILLCFSLIFLSGNIPSFSQNQTKPKVALVLSGGGAKGIAHVALLQKLDSLNIVPDLVVGTSMGSIIGGLYAIGYSGDSIASIVETIDWDFISENRISLKDVSIEEKGEFGKYLTELDLVKGKPNFRNELLSDQGIRELFSELTYPVLGIDDFDDLPIPYRAIAVDIVKGKLVIIDKGKIRNAMRASMSIPGVFKPIEMNGTLLVDGGVLNNFPTDVAKDLGADIIIGSDVGGGMTPKEDLDNLTNLLFQTGMLNSNLLNSANRALCDILLVHKTKEIYSFSDFNKLSAIYKSGIPAVNDNLEQLIKLSKQLKQFEQRKIKLPEVPEKLKIDRFKFENISEENLALVKARFNLKEGDYYEVKDVIDGIQHVMGTTLFENIIFDGAIHSNDVELVIKGVEHAQHRAKISLHYDDYRGVGVVLNYTGRNVIGEASKLLFTIDIAEQPKIRTLHQIHFGNLKNIWWESEFIAEFLRQDLFKNGETIDKVKYQFYNANTQFNINTNALNSSIGMGFEYRHTGIYPSKVPKLNNNLLNLKSYHFNHLDGFIHFKFNSFDARRFATRGSSIYLRLSQSFISDVQAEHSSVFLPELKGKTNGFARINLESEHRIVLGTTSTIVLGANAGFIFENLFKSDAVSFEMYGVAAQYTLGGYFENSRFNSHRFKGFHEDELIVTQFMNLNFGLQWNPIKKIYVTPHVDVATVGFGKFNDFFKKALTPDGNWEETTEESLLLSAGALFEYNSPLGPLKLDFSWVNKIDKLSVFFGIGMFF